MLHKKNNRSLDVKDIQAMPDDFDIIKVTALTTTGDIIKVGSIYTVSANGTPTALPTVDSTPETTNHIATEDITLLADDEAKILGYERDYSAIQVYEPAFGNNLTDIIINGVGKNMSDLNDVISNGDMTWGNFQAIALPVTSTSMVIKAYK